MVPRRTQLFFYLIQTIIRNEFAGDAPKSELLPRVSDRRQTNARGSLWLDHGKRPRKSTQNGDNDFDAVALRYKQTG